MTTESPTLRHLGNDAADRLVLYLQDDAPPEIANQHIACNPRCHAFDAGVVAGRMPEILDEARRTERLALVDRLRERLWFATRLNDERIGVRLIEQWLDDEAVPARNVNGDEIPF